MGAAVQRFLATEGVAAHLGAIIWSLTPDFVYQARIPAPVGHAESELAVALLTGETRSPPCRRRWPPWQPTLPSSPR